MKTPLESKVYIKKPNQKRAKISPAFDLTQYNL